MDYSVKWMATSRGFFTLRVEIKRKKGGLIDVTKGVIRQVFPTD